MTEFRKASAAVETVEKLIGELQGDVKLAEQGELPAESHARWTEVSWTYLGNPWENHRKFWSQWFYQLQVISCYIIIIYNNYITYHHSLSSFLHCFIFLWRYLGLSTILKQRQVEKQFNELSPVAEKMQRRCDARSELEKLKEELRALLPPCSPEECMKKAQELVDGQVSGFESVQEILSKALDLEATATRWWFQRFFWRFSIWIPAIPCYSLIFGYTWLNLHHLQPYSPAIPSHTSTASTASFRQRMVWKWPRRSVSCCCAWRRPGAASRPCGLSWSPWCGSWTTGPRRRRRSATGNGRRKRKRRNGKRRKPPEAGRKMTKIG